MAGTTQGAAVLQVPQRAVVGEHERPASEGGAGAWGVQGKEKRAHVTKAFQFKAQLMSPARNCVPEAGGSLLVASAAQGLPADHHPFGHGRGALRALRTLALDVVGLA